MKELLGWSLDGALDPWSCLRKSLVIKIQAGVLYTQTGIRDALKGILLKGNLMLMGIKDSFLLHLNWECQY